MKKRVLALVASLVLILSLYANAVTLIGGHPYDTISGAPIVELSGGGSNASQNTSTASQYTVLSTFADANGICTGGSTPDTLENIIVLGATGAGIASSWINLTQGFALAANPPSADIALDSVNPLTNTQLRASPLAISGVVSGAVTANIGISNGIALDASVQAVKSALGTPIQQTGGSVGLVAGSATIGSIANAGFTANQPTAANLNATVVGNGVFAVQNTAPVVGGNAIAVKVDNSAVTQPVSVTSLPLPAGAAKDSTLQSIATAIQTLVDISGSVWVDETISPAVYYIRNQSVNATTGSTTVTWTNPAGVIQTPTLSNLVPVGSLDNVENVTSQYVANASGTGYALGNILILAYGINGSSSPAEVVYTFWLNASTGLVLAATPTSGTFAQTTQNVSGSVTANAGTNLNTSALALEAGGNLATVAIKTTSIANQLPTSVGQKTSANSLPVVLASDESLPLPTGAATGALQTTGNAVLATIAVNTTTSNAGTSATGALPIQGVTGGIAVPVSGTFWQTTQPISVTTLPLPAGAATSENQTNVQSAAGTVSSTVISVQGNSSGIAIPVSQSGSNWSINYAQVGGANIVTAATGVQKVGVVGNSGVAVDSVAGTPNAQVVSIQGNASGVVVPVQIASATIPTQATFSTTTSTAIVASSTTRKSLSVFNDYASGQILYLLAGTGTASSTNYTYALQPGGSFVATPQELGYAWAGVFAASPSKNAQVTYGQ